MKGKIVIACLIVLVACKPETPVENNNNTNTTTDNTPKVETKPRVVPPDFNGDSAFAYVKYQADLGPRTPGSKAHEKAVDYYEKQFKRFGAQVLIQAGNTTTFD